jgi:leader peptidase (prepilin peptidase)/N-methyltransferase
MFLRGKCFFCSERISWRYPSIEIITGIISFLLFPEDLSTGSLTNYIFYFSIACVFICHFMIDLDHHLLLDSLNLYLLILFLIHSFFFAPFDYWILGGGIGFGAPLLVTWLFYKIRGQVGLGGGDIKLFGILGIFLGPLGIVFNIFLSCFLGAIIGIGLIFVKKLSRDKPMAFGPAILLVAAFQIFLPDYARMVQSWIFPN